MEHSHTQQGSLQGAHIRKNGNGTGQTEVGLPANRVYVVGRAASTDRYRYGNVGRWTTVRWAEEPRTQLSASLMRVHN